MIKMNKKYDQIGSFIWILLGVLFCIGSVQVGLGEVSSPESGFFPFLTGSSMAAMGFLFMVSRVFQPAKGKGRQEGVSIPTFRSRGVLCLMALFIYSFLLEPLGFILATLFLFIALFKIMDPRHWASPIFFSVSAVTVSYFLFCILLRVNFPKGIMGIG